jgi:hypothetical protein
MPKILVDKNELKRLRDNIDYLLETGKQSFSISINNQSMKAMI